MTVSLDMCRNGGDIAVRPARSGAIVVDEAASTRRILCRKEITNVKRNRSTGTLSLLATAAIFLSACSNAPATLPYTAGAKVTCGGDPSLNASGSTAQSNAMTRFINAYTTACPGKTLNYTANGSGAGVSDFLAGKTDFAGSDIPLAGDQYAAAKKRCGGADAWNLPVVFGPHRAQRINAVRGYPRHLPQ